MDGNTDLPKTAPEKTDLNERKELVDPFIGIVLNERYQINELIGVGGWGSVYKAAHLAFERDVAIKIAHRHHMQDKDNIQRFKREARALNRIDSDSVVKVIDADIDPYPFIVMELFDGEPLNRWIERCGAMDAQMAIDLFVQICDGLSAADALKIVHRDLKTANVLLKTQGNTVEAKILDFGLAKFMDHQSTAGKNITATGDILGSPPYMSPEQWRGQADNRSDIYSLGCIMYEVLAGKPAFYAQYGLDYLHKHLSEKPKPIAEVNPRAKLPAGLEGIVRKCMEKSPGKRYQTSELCSHDLTLVKNGAMPQNFSVGKFKLTKAKAIPLAIVLLLVAVFVAVPLLQEMNKPAPGSANLEGKFLTAGTLVASSFPQEWAGYWGGVLTVKSQFDWQNRPPRPAFAPGQSATTIFDFIRGADYIYHKPPTMFFKTETKALGEVADAPESLQARARAGTSDPNQMLKSVPTIKLGNVAWTMLNGTSHKETVTSIKVLTDSQGLYQEEMTKLIEHHAPNALDTKFYSLVVFRIKEISPGMLAVQIERTIYGADRGVRSRQIAEGTLTRDWQSYAKEISQQTRRAWNNVVAEFDI